MMKKLFLFYFAFSSCLYAQVLVLGSWLNVKNTTLKIVFDDADNGDNIADGAIYVDGLSQQVGQGALYNFQGAIKAGESIHITTCVYNRNASFVKLYVDLYNKTDNRQLAKSSLIFIANNSSDPVTVNLNYTASSIDNGDQLQVRYIRSDDGNVARNFAIDNLYLNGDEVSTNIGGACPFTYSPDLNLVQMQ